MAHVHTQQSKGPISARPQDSRARLRLAYLVTHPIQYQAPLLRRVASEPDIDLTVFFGSNLSVRGYQDKGFGVDVKWDVPLLDGYRYEFLPVLRDTANTGPLKPLNYGIGRRLLRNNGTPAFDALWLHGYSTANALHAMIAAKAIGIPVILRAESWLMKESRAKRTSKRFFFNLLQHLVDAVLPVGTKNKEFWQHHFGPEFPMFMTPYAVDNHFFQTRIKDTHHNRFGLIQELNLDPDRPVILFASKLQSRKNCADLLEAYCNLSPSPNIAPHPYLLIVGDGEQRQSLEQRARLTGWDTIRFCGFRNQTQMPAFFDLATVFVLPSYREAWGLVVNEAMNAGKAVIVSDEVGCQPDLIRDDIEGCVFQAGNISALTEALKKVLNNPDIATEMGRRAFDRISQWGLPEDISGLRQALAAVTGKLSA